MSWSIDVVGMKSDVVQKVTEQLDKIAASYDGKEEGKDVAAVKERILAIVEAMNVDDERPGELAVYVKANGSHGWNGDKLVVANLTMNVGRTTPPG
jgi:hypothetical protein